MTKTAIGEVDVVLIARIVTAVEPGVLVVMLIVMLIVFPPLQRRPLLKLSRVPVAVIALERIDPAVEKKSVNETVTPDAETAGIANVNVTETAIVTAKETVTVIANVTGIVTAKKTVTASANETENAPAATEPPPPTATTPPASTLDA